LQLTLSLPPSRPRQLRHTLAAKYIVPGEESWIAQHDFKLLYGETMEQQECKIQTSSQCCCAHVRAQGWTLASTSVQKVLGFLDHEL